MSENNITNQVLEIKFDNKVFEKNIQDTLASLKELKTAMNFDGTRKSFDELEKTTSNFNLNPMEEAAKKAGESFDIMQVMGVTAIVKIANAAMDYGTKIVKSLTIDPVKAGWDEYALKMDSMKTILSSTGESIDTVNGYLEELNRYSDETIYSFADMTNNIGKFTNAGVDLDSAVMAIKGISNEAALSGANANEASRAMYNFAQALSSGAVKLIDWKSIENANMATAEFKQQLIDTAVALGTVVEINGEYQSVTTDNNGHVSELFTSTAKFNDSLSTQWMTTDVLIQTLSRYADETTDVGARALLAAKEVRTFAKMMDTLQEAVGSGWARIWEYVIGDVEEATQLWSGMAEVMSNIISSVFDPITEALEIWHDYQGRFFFIEGLKNIYAAIRDIIVSIADAFGSVFEGIDGWGLRDLSVEFLYWTKSLQPSEELLESLHSAAMGFFSVIKLLLEPAKVLWALTKGIINFVIKSGIITVLTKFAGLIGSIATLLVDFITVDLDLFGKLATVITDFFEYITAYAGGITESISNIISEITTKLYFGDNSPWEQFMNFLQNIGDYAIIAYNKIHDFFTNTNKEELKNEALEKYQALWEKTGTVLEKVWGILEKVGAALKSIAVAIGEQFKEAFQGVTFFNIMDGVKNALEIGLLGGIGSIVVNLRKKILGKDGIVEAINGIGESLGGVLKSWQNSLNADAIKKIAISLLLIAASIALLAMVDEERAMSGAIVMGVLLAELMKLMQLMKETDSSGLRSSGGLALKVVALAIAIGIIAGSLSKIANNDPNAIYASTAAISAIILMVGKLLKSISGVKFSSKKDIAGLLVIATVVKTLAKAIAILANVAKDNMDGMLVASGVIAGLFVTIALVAKTLGSEKKNKDLSGEINANIKYSNMMSDFGKGLIEIAATIAILIGALWLLTKIVSNTDPEVLNKSLWILGVTLASIFAFLIAVTAITKGDKNTIETNLSGGLKDLLKGSNFKMETSSAGKMLQQAGLAMIEISAAIIILVAAVAAMAEIIARHKPETIDKAISTVGVILAAMMVIIIIVTAITKNAKGSSLSAAALTLAAFGVSMIMVAESIVIIAGALSVLALVAEKNEQGFKAATDSLVVMIKMIGITLSVIMALKSFLKIDNKELLTIGATFILFGVAIQAMATGLAALATIASLPGGVGGIIAATMAIGVMLGIFIAAGKFLGDSAEKIVILSKALLLFGVSITLIGVGVLAFVEALVLFSAINAVVWTAALTTIVAITPLLVLALTALIHSIIGAIRILFPELVDLYKELLVYIVDAVDATIAAAFEALLVSLEAVLEYWPKVIPLLTEVIWKLLDWLIENIGPIAAKLTTIIFELLLVVLEGLIIYIPKIIKLVMKLVLEILESLAKEIGNQGTKIVDAVFDILLALVKVAITAITGLGKFIAEAVKTIVETFLDAIKDFFETFKDLDSDEASFSIEDMINTILKLDELLLALSGAALLAPVALAGIIELAAVVTALGVFLTDLGALNSIPGVNSLMTKGGELLITMGTAIGGFFGAITGSFAAVASTGLPTIGANMASFATNAAPFFDLLKTIDDTAIAGATALVAVIGALILEDFVSSIMEFIGLGNPFENLSTNLKSLGEGVAAFYKAVATMNSEKLSEKSKAAAALIDALANIPKEGGLMDWINGTTMKPENLKANFKGLAEGVTEFDKYSKGVSAANVTEGAIAAKNLLYKLKDVTMGSLASEFATDKGETLKENLMNLGKGVFGFWYQTKNVDSEKIQNATVALGNILDALGEHEANDGIIKKVLLDDSGDEITRVQTNLVGLATGVKDFAWIVKDIGTYHLKNVTDSMNALFESIPEMYGGIENSWEQTLALTNFSSDMVKLAEGISIFAQEIGGVDITVLTKATSNANQVITTFSKLKKTDTENMAIFANSLKSLGEIGIIGGFMENLITNADSALKKIRSFVNDAINAVIETKGVSNVERFKTASGNLATALKKGFTSKLSYTIEESNPVDEFIKGIISTLNKYIQEDQTLYGKGAALMLQIVDGFASYIDQPEKYLIATNAIFNMMQSLSNSASIEAYKGSLQSGKFFIDGFVDGIKDTNYVKKIKDAATLLGKQALVAFNNSIGVESPSKETYKTGSFFIEGFTNAIANNEKEISDATKTIGEESVDAFNTALSYIQSLIESDVDFTPTISPVLDLTNVEANAKRLNAMLSTDMAYGINSAIESSRGNRQNGNSESSSSNDSPPVIVNMTVNGAQGQDVNELAEIISYKLNKSINRRKSVWA